MEVLSNLELSHIEAKGRKFNLDFHEAVAHVEDENFGKMKLWRSSSKDIFSIRRNRHPSFGCKGCKLKTFFDL